MPHGCFISSLISIGGAIAVKASFECLQVIPIISLHYISRALYYFRNFGFLLFIQRRNSFTDLEKKKPCYNTQYSMDRSRYARPE